MSAPALSADTALPRILLELGEGRLDDDSAEALGAWITSEGLIEPPETLIKRSLRLFGGIAAGVA